MVRLQVTKCFFIWLGFKGNCAINAIRISGSIADYVVTGLIENWLFFPGSLFTVLA